LAAIKCRKIFKNILNWTIKSGVGSPKVRHLRIAQFTRKRKMDIALINQSDWIGANTINGVAQNLYQKKSSYKHDATFITGPLQ